MTKPRAVVVSLAIALVAGAARGALMLEHITVRAGEETTAILQMWPAWLWSVSLFAISVRAFWPDSDRVTDDDGNG